MKIYLQWPKSGSQKTLFPILVLLTIYFGASVFEESFRSEADLLEGKEVCGVITKYAFDIDSGKGFDTWRLYINSDQGFREVFKVGYPYLHNVLQKEDMTQGRQICIRFIPQVVRFDHPFISQLYLDEIAVLDNKWVLSEYTKSPDRLIQIFVIITFVLALICLIKITRS